MEVQDSLLKKINQTLRIPIFLVLNIFKLLQYQRDESTEKRGKGNHGWKIGTKKRNTGITKERALVLQENAKNAV